MAYDVGKGIYTIKAFLPDGKVVNLSNVQQQLSWSEQNGELAKRASITFANVQTSEGLVNGLLKLCTKIIIYANEVPVFDGMIWDYDYSSAQKRDVQVMCYDNLIYLTKSKEHYYYTKGKTTSAIIGDICSRWGIGLSYDYVSINHPKTLFKGTSISDNILKLIKEADKKLGKKSVVLFENNQLVVRERGQNKEVYIFEASKNVEQTEYKITMDNLVTQVMVLGKEDKEGRAAVKAEVKGQTEFGVLQELVYIDGDGTLEEAKKDAQGILDERGKPKETMFVDCADVPMLRKGDKIKLAAGNLLGYFYVLSVSHDATSKKMHLEVER